MINKLYLLLLVVLFAACRTTQPEVITNTIVKDSLITIPPDSAWLYALIECDSNRKAHLREIKTVNQDPGAININQASITNNRLAIQATTAPKQIIITKYKIQRQQTKVFVRITNQLTGVQKFFYWIGLGTLIALCTFVLYKFIAMKKYFLILMAAVTLTSCATILGGSVTECQRTKPVQGQPSRQVRAGALIADLLLFWPGAIVDFATGAIYKPCVSPPKPQERVN